MNKNIIYRVIILINILFIQTFLYSQTTTSSFTKNSEINEHRINFKGFLTIINDIASDELGNHLIVGRIKIIENLNKNRDSTINRVFHLQDNDRNDSRGIIIATDKNYKIIGVENSWIGRKVIYNPAKKEFIVGASDLKPITHKKQYFSVFQPVIITTSIALDLRTYMVEKDYSCYLQDIKLEGEDILIFAESTLNRSIKERVESIEIIRMNTAISKTHKEFKNIQILKPLNTWMTPHRELGRISISVISKVKNSYYFATSNLNQFDLENIHHFYRFSNSKLNEIAHYSTFLKWNSKHAKWIRVNGILVDSNSNISILFHVALKKEMVFTKTDTSFWTSFIKKNIPINYSCERDQFIVLSNGNIVTVSIDSNNLWSYYLYNNKMELLKEVSTGLSIKYNPNRLIEITKNEISSVFYIDNKIGKDCVLQNLNLNN